MSAIEIKYFTPKEAKKTLPLVRQIVGDIIVSGKRLETLLPRLAIMQTKTPKLRS